MISFAGQLGLRAALRDDGRTVLAEQSFRAPFHLSKPYWDAEAGTLIVQIVNPTAGILAGDTLHSSIVVDAAAALLVTTPSASRIFTMREGVAECHQRFAVGPGGWLEFAPEPLVPHRNSRYRQTTRIDVAPGGELLFVDQLMPGRIGHGEAWAWSELCLDLEVRLAGELILRERFAPNGPELRDLAAAAGSGASACFANAVLLASTGESARAEDWQNALRALHRDGIWFGVSSLRRGGWSFKIVAPDAVRLRDTVRRMRDILGAHFAPLSAQIRKF